MAFGVKFKLRAFAAFGIVATLVVGAVGYHGQSRQSTALGDVNAKLGMLRTQMEADMMHDALRADVLSAMRAASHRDTAGHQEVMGELDEHSTNFRKQIEELQQSQHSAEVDERLTKVLPALGKYIDGAQDIAAKAMENTAAAETAMPAFLQLFSDLEGPMSELSDLIEKDATAAEAAAQATAQQSVNWMLTVIAISAVGALLVSLVLIRGITTPLRELFDAIAGIRRNDGTTTRLQGFKAEFADIEREFNGLLDELEERQRLEQARAEAAFRVQQALDAATANVVLADGDLNLVYVNTTARSMFERHASEFRQTLSGFDAARLVGSGLAHLYRGSAAEQALATLAAPRTDELRFGGRTFSVTATAVRDHEGKRIGVVCEWVDLTEQRDAENQIQAVLEDAIAGRLDTRLDVDRFRGFTRALAESMNKMLDAITAPLTIAAAHLKHIADGNIPAPITAEFRGAFDEIKNNLNTCTDVLRAMIDDVTRLVDAAAAGKLDERAALDRHWGDYRTIVDGMNDMLNAVAGPVAAARTVMTGLAAGDLSQRMQGEYKGEFAVLRDAVDTSVDNLSNMVRRINGTANSINTSATEIAKGNQDLNRRTQEQAASIEETSTAIQSLTSRVQENTANARQANQLAASARDEAETGGKVVNDAIHAMSAINVASSKIADIISVIDGIAFQTNLLALNAAVEAARAGEQGRGFAVVAAEVRNLAQSSAAAAKEIKELIGDSVDKVNHGTELVNASGTTLRDIVQAVKSVSDIIGEITAASEEQLGGIEQLNKAVAQLDEVTQQNAALVEEATAASESMDDESRAMTELMAFFKGEASSATDTSAPSTPAVERRKAGRPWSGSGPAQAERDVVSASSSKVAQGGSQGDVWSEF